MVYVDLRRLMQVWAPESRQASSGHLIGKRLVLTAWHSTADGEHDDGDELKVRLFDQERSGEWVTARRVWPTEAPELAAHPGRDVALVEITDTKWIPPASLQPVRFGRLVKGDPVDCRAVGFPRAQKRPDGRSGSKDILGSTEPGSEMGFGLVVFHVTNSAPVQDGAWAGGSGAALYCGGLIVGVLVEDQEGYHGRQLKAVSLAQLAKDTGLKTALKDAGVPAKFKRANGSAWASFRQWSRVRKLIALVVATATIAAAVVIPLLLASDGNGASGHSPASGPINNYINNYGPTSTGAALSNDPQAEVVQLTGSWSEQGFVNAVIDRDTSIVALYLKSGMTAKTLHEGASAILWGFQGVPQNGDPVALVKAFQAAGFKVDDELQDSYLMFQLSDGIFPLMFDTDLAPKGYTGGYQDGTFVGSLLFWIVQRALGTTATDQDIQVIRYLISQGADCKVTLSFMEFNSTTLSGLSKSAYEELLPMMQSCAK